ncbi:MAG: hypothetical protein WCE25_11740 [Nitrososphaeraceae archaeon]
MDLTVFPVDQEMIDYFTALEPPMTPKQFFLMVIKTSLTVAQARTQFG